MQLLAETLRKRGINATAATLGPNNILGYQNDIMFNKTGKKARLSHYVFFIWTLIHYDVFHFYFGVSFLSFWRFHYIDLPILKFFKKRIVVHFRGSDIVDKQYYNYLNNINLGEKAPQIKMSRPDQVLKVKKWTKFADVILVSTPNLLELVPQAFLSPQLIDLKYWKTEKPPLSRTDGILRIVHAPTRRDTKGTRFILDAIEGLKKKGYRIELVLVEDLSHEKVKEVFENCDIGIDQLLIGWHGKVAVELMMLGRPVICYIKPEYRKYRPELPIVSANYDTLEHELEELILNEQKRIELGHKSREYAIKYHDVEKEASRLISEYY